MRLDDGWVAWENYREAGRVRLIWDLPSGGGRREIPKGSGITDLALSSDGALIAVSTTTNLNIGDVRDSLFVLRSRDGAEVYRRYFRQYTRTRLALPGRPAPGRDPRRSGQGWRLDRGARSPRGRGGAVRPGASANRDIAVAKPFLKQNIGLCGSTASGPRMVRMRAVIVLSCQG